MRLNDTDDGNKFSELKLDYGIPFQVLSLEEDNGELYHGRTR
jgi:hypothetical protein